MNEITDERFSFFGLEVELWRIVGSPIVAPKFNIVSNPNDWSKEVATSARQAALGGLNEAGQLRLDFWNGFAKYVHEQGSFLKIPTPRPDPSIGLSIGKAGCFSYAQISTRDKNLEVGIAFEGPTRHDRYAALFAQKSEIEKELGTTMEWIEVPKRFYINLVVNADPQQREQWPARYGWLREKLEAIDRVFRPRVRMLLA